MSSVTPLWHVVQLEHHNDWKSISPHLVHPRPIISTVVTERTYSHAVGAFLDEGYPVRGTVRSQDKGEYLAKLFAGKAAKFEYAIVRDIAEVSGASITYTSMHPSSMVGLGRPL
jgi:hypothetical protein